MTTVPLVWPPLVGWPDSVRIGYTQRGDTADGSPYDFNLGDHVGDDPVRVARHRELLRSQIPGAGSLLWMNQVHGVQIAYVKNSSGSGVTADGLWTDQPGICCAVLTADCLPILLTDGSGTRVAAVHAGWRGLVDGVVEAACEALGGAGSAAYAWLGPAIGPEAFEVGPEVRERFLQAAPGTERDATAACFEPSADANEKYQADLRSLAILRLTGARVEHISGEHACTYQDSGRFFSYRRDGQTGRMATFIMLRDKS